ncbi:hypothetical protein WJX81_001151 [Elliptochloris bilobata]|uniref:Uncharacterized protein n=1 Tax=Elliptochloris bilobata TaxID=381761 RepID=A0AAW1RIA6_9CHLO
MMSQVLFSSVASPAAHLSFVSPFDLPAQGRVVILTAETCDAAAQETASKLVEEFVRLATSQRDHDRSVAAFFLNEITCVIEARRRVQSEVLASLAPTTVRLLADTRLFSPAGACDQTGTAAAPPPDAALLLACARFLRFGAVHHPHLLLGGTQPAGGGPCCALGPQGLTGSLPGAVAAAAACLEGLAGFQEGAVALRTADVKRGRAHLLSLILHLADHPWCPLAEVAAVAAPGGWLRARLLRLRAGKGRASTLAAALLARVGAHPSDAAACQAQTAEADEDALLEEGGAPAGRPPARGGRPPSGRRGSVDIRQPRQVSAGAAAPHVRTRTSMDGRADAGSYAAARDPVPIEGVEGPSHRAPSV